MNVQFIKNSLFIFLGCALTITSVHAVSSPQPLSEESAVDLISKARKSIVNIEARMPLSSRMGPFGDALERKLENQAHAAKWYVSMGSGVIWDENGHIITTSSIVDQARDILVKCNDGHSYNARVIGSDDVTNLSVLKLIDVNTHYLTPVRKRIDKLPEGSTLFLMGYGYGGIPTVSPGMAGMPPEDYETGRHWFQFTAPMRPGNSGGALIDSNGKLAGIVLGREQDLGFNAVVKMLTSNQQKQSSNEMVNYSSFGLGVPMNQAAPVIEQIIREGQVARGWMGISVRKVTEVHSGDYFIVVVRVVPGSPADSAGLEVGDHILCMDSVDITDPLVLGRIIQNNPPGTKIAIDFDRDGQQLRTELILAERPSQQPVKPDKNAETQPGLTRRIHVLEGQTVEH